MARAAAILRALPGAALVLALGACALDLGGSEALGGIELALCLKNGDAAVLLRLRVLRFSLHLRRPHAVLGIAKGAAAYDQGEGADRDDQGSFADERAVVAASVTHVLLSCLGF